ncbi:MAG TPA: Phenylacetic acid catabolic protein [Myxococcota bacterium]|jgi:1,2-phenylacetyl-CoA epoxidase catalytic subunit|nr:Phenylacetic acid catabolic protein [Myxococcota bacterium]
MSTPETSGAAAPVLYERREDMPERYRTTLEQMMKSQAYRELAAARMFGHGLQYVPALKWHKFLVWHIGEETEHYAAVAKMYERFTGESVEPWVNARLADKPVPFATSWFELAMAQYLYDRGGFWQLQEYENCTFPPYREVIGKIIEEERGHQGLGEKLVVELAQTGAFDDVKQPLFERWLRIGLLSFGRPHTEGNRYAIAVGLKKRDSAECFRDFLADVKPAMRAAALHFPAPAALEMDLPADLDWSL